MTGAIPHFFSSNKTTELILTRNGYHDRREVVAGFPLKSCTMREKAAENNETKANSLVIRV